MLNWAILSTWENWLLIPLMAFFFFFLAAILSDLIEEK